jgi:hypothetical protein
MTRAGRLVASIAVVTLACDGDSTAPRPLDGAFALVAENAQPLPSDPSAPYGCCLTLSGSLTFAAATYDLRTSHRNKNNGITFDNSEQGTYTRQGNTLRFTRTGGGGEGFPYLLGPGTVSADNDTVTLPTGTRTKSTDPRDVHALIGAMLREVLEEACRLHASRRAGGRRTPTLSEELLAMSSLLGWTGATLGGGLGWWVGAQRGVVSAFLLSMLGTGAV